MLNRFINEITNNHLCDKGHKILLAVSGGADSMVMLNLFHAAGYEVGVAHCNFKLRGEESDEDEYFVQKVCDQLQIPFYIKTFSTNNYAVENGLSIQMAARELRYMWFDELMENDRYDRLATAHHLNDNIETTLLNLIRGTGISGLRGIPPMLKRVIRPLLGFTQEELVAYAQLNEILWREDTSNKTDDYDRNFLRHQVIPKLRQINPSLEDSFKRTNQRLLGGEALFQLGLDQLKREFVRKENNQLKIGKAFLKVTEFPAVVAWELIKEYGFNFTQCVEAVEASNGTSGKKFHSTNYQLVIDRDTWIISKQQERLKGLDIKEDDREVSLGNFIMNIEKDHDKSFFDNPMIAVLDAEKVSFPFTWRKWEEGDFFVPLGMNNRRKLSDFFIDKKMSIVDKDVATVIEAHGEIVWVVGQRIDNRYKVSDQTKEVIRLTVQSHL